jgi:hypothetical protein
VFVEEWGGRGGDPAEVSSRPKPGLPTGFEKFLAAGGNAAARKRGKKLEMRPRYLASWTQCPSTQSYRIHDSTKNEEPIYRDLTIDCCLPNTFRSFMITMMADAIDDKVSVW